MIRHSNPISLKPGCEARCPACPHRSYTKEESLDIKQKFLQNKLSAWTGLTEPFRSVEEEKRWGYRDKVRLHTQWIEGKWKAGIIRNEILIPIPDCPVESEAVRTSCSNILKMLPPPEVFPMVFYIQSGKQVTLVVKQSKNKFQPGREELSERLSATANIEGLWLHFNPSAGNKVFMKGGWELLFGEPVSVDDYGLYYGPASFQQAIPALFRDAMTECVRFLSPEDSVVTDLFTGTGASIRTWTAHKAEKVIGVESGMESVNMARRNNPGMEILLGNCEDRIPQVDEFVNKHCLDRSKLKLFVNPPRTGFSEKLIQWIVQNLKPAKIAYLSCSPGTLSRDLTFFSSNNYRVHRIIPYDFLPQTLHIEALALLSVK